MSGIPRDRIIGLVEKFVKSQPCSAERGNGLADGFTQGYIAALDMAYGCIDELENADNYNDFRRLATLIKKRVGK